MSTAATLTVTTPNDREIVMTRMLNAPRGLIYDYYTKPELLKRWLGPDGWDFAICDNDLTEGGAYRWVWRNPTGTEIGLHGTYLDIVKPEKITRTEIFNQDAESETLGILTLSQEDGGGTLVKTHVAFASREARERAMEAGMAKGVSASFDKLDALLQHDINKNAA